MSRARNSTWMHWEALFILSMVGMALDTKKAHTNTRGRKNKCIGTRHSVIRKDLRDVRGLIEDTQCDGNAIMIGGVTFFSWRSSNCPKYHLAKRRLVVHYGGKQVCRRTKASGRRG
jgi:hypothetical protein